DDLDFGDLVLAGGAQVDRDGAGLSAAGPFDGPVGGGGDGERVTGLAGAGVGVHVSAGGGDGCVGSCGPWRVVGRIVRRSWGIVPGAGNAAAVAHGVFDSVQGRGRRHGEVAIAG